MASPAERRSRFVATIERFSERTGKVLYWLTLGMVLIGSYNAIVRYLGRYIGSDLSSNAYIELQWYLFSLVFLLGAAYTLKHDAHVRVDVVYARLSERGRAWINLLGTILFLLPFCLLMVWVSWSSVTASWAVREISPDPGGLPRYPIKTVIPIAFLLLILQGVAYAVRNASLLLSGHSGADEARSGEEGE